MKSQHDFNLLFDWRTWYNEARNSNNRQIVLQSLLLVILVMAVSYCYGLFNYTPVEVNCPPAPKYNFSGLTGLGCTSVPEKFIFPVSWLGMLLFGIAGTLVFGLGSFALHQSVFSRFLFLGWLSFCTVAALVNLLIYWQIGPESGRYLAFYPATVYVALGNVASGVVAILNIYLLARENS